LATDYGSYPTINYFIKKVVHKLKFLTV